MNEALQTPSPEAELRMKRLVLVAIVMKRETASGEEERRRADPGGEGRKSRVDREQLAHLFLKRAVKSRRGAAKKTNRLFL
jgi:hypothetical protein